MSSGWVIEVREDIDTPWISGGEADVDSRIYESKADAQKRVRELRSIGLLLPYDAVRVVPLKETAR